MRGCVCGVRAGNESVVATVWWLQYTTPPHRHPPTHRHTLDALSIIDKMHRIVSYVLSSPWPPPVLLSRVPISSSLTCPSHPPSPSHSSILHPNIFIPSCPPASPSRSHVQLPLQLSPRLRSIHLISSGPAYVYVYAYLLGEFLHLPSTSQSHHPTTIPHSHSAIPRHPHTHSLPASPPHPPGIHIPIHIPSLPPPHQVPHTCPTVNIPNRSCRRQSTSHSRPGTDRQTETLTTGGKECGTTPIQLSHPIPSHPIEPPPRSALALPCVPRRVGVGDGDGDGCTRFCFWWDIMGYYGGGRV